MPQPGFSRLFFHLAKLSTFGNACRCRNGFHSKEYLLDVREMKGKAGGESRSLPITSGYVLPAEAPREPGRTLLSVGNMSDTSDSFILEPVATVLRWKSPNHPFFLASGKRTECRPELPALRGMIARGAPSINSP